MYFAYFAVPPSSGDFLASLHASYIRNDPAVVVFAKHIPWIAARVPIVGNPRLISLWDSCAPTGSGNCYPARSKEWRPEFGEILSRPLESLVFKPGTATNPFLSAEFAIQRPIVQRDERLVVPDVFNFKHSAGPKFFTG